MRRHGAGGGLTARSKLVAVAVAGCVAMGLGGCAASDSPTAPDAASDATTDDASSSSFVIDQDFPDPDVLTTDDGYIAFATNSPGLNLQWATSTDLASWTVSTDDALPVLPSWASAGRTWAPDVSAAPGGGYLLYFTAEHTATGKQCIGVATSEAPTGPYTPQGTEPIICPFDDGGAIDASTFTDVDGSPYLVWKNDGNCCGLDTWLQLSTLSADGLAVEGDPVRLMKQTEAWEGDLVEAPTLVRHGDAYVLLYSANDYGGDDYAMGVATAPTIAGPYTKQPEPLLTTASSNDAFRGPGGQDIIVDDDGDTLVFHSWDENYIYRGMNTAPIEWDGDVPRIVLP
ncbi:glycoside hydrolase family 43 protein [Leifsonia sp. YIM 134122]|uniref:Glycoside hydrolase family 43 protein n=1 Tax=Leifsonia stereocauli TaxID=3134136 RepID=A0ABU9W4P2_9MICO